MSSPENDLQVPKSVQILRPWTKGPHTPIWWNFINPSEEDLEFASDKFGISKSTLLDCLLPVHLPQFVRSDVWSQVLLRCYESSGQRQSTVQDITRKFVIFWGDTYLITISRKPVSFLQVVLERICNEGERRLADATSRKGSATLCETIETYVAFLSSGVLETFEGGLDEIEKSLDVFEVEAVKREVQSPQSLQRLHEFKKKVTILRRTLWRTAAVLDATLSEINMRKSSRWRQVCERAHRLHFYSEELENAVLHVMNFQLSISNLYIAQSSQRTNEVMRTLTLFSVIFLPLTLIAGVYGMNFEYMPELRHPYGYFGTLLIMGLIAVSLLLWFQHKGFTSLGLKKKM